MNKMIMVVAVFLCMVAPVAYADWVEDFMNTFAKKGVEPAVEEAFKVGVSPADIVKMTKEAGGLEPADVVKALYCLGVSGSVVQAAASGAGLPESAVAVGYKQSIGQCGPAAALNPDPFSRTADIAAKGSPIGGGGEFPGTPPGTDGGTPPPVILPPVDGGVGGTRPPSVSPARP